MLFYIKIVPPKAAPYPAFWAFQSTNLLPFFAKQTQFTARRNEHKSCDCKWLRKSEGLLVPPKQSQFKAKQTQFCGISSNDIKKY
jgi:hypothetical protein